MNLHTLGASTYDDRHSCGAYPREAGSDGISKACMTYGDTCQACECLFRRLLAPLSAALHQIADNQVTKVAVLCFKKVCKVPLRRRCYHKPSITCVGLWLAKIRFDVMTDGL